MKTCKLETTDYAQGWCRIDMQWWECTSTNEVVTISKTHSDSARTPTAAAGIPVNNQLYQHGLGVQHAGKLKINARGGITPSLGQMWVVHVWALKLGLCVQHPIRQYQTHVDAWGMRIAHNAIMRLGGKSAKQTSTTVCEHQLDDMTREDNKTL